MENQQVHDAQLSIDAQEEQAYQEEARRLYVIGEIKTFVFMREYNAIDSYLAGFDRAIHSDFNLWLYEDEKNQELIKAYLAGIDLVDNSELVAAAYYDYLAKFYSRSWYKTDVLDYMEVECDEI